MQSMSSIFKHLIHLQMLFVTDLSEHFPTGFAFANQNLIAKGCATINLYNWVTIN